MAKQSIGMLAATCKKWETPTPHRPRLAPSDTEIDTILDEVLARLRLIDEVDTGDVDGKTPTPDRLPLK